MADRGSTRCIFWGYGEGRAASLSLWQALVLGIIQGATEFLPISSSGHLVVVERLLGLELPGVTFEVVVHVGTLLAVLAFYRNDVSRVVRSCASTLLSGGHGSREDGRLFWLLVVGTLPAVLVGLGLKPVIDQVFASLRVVGVGWLVTGSLLWIAHRRLQADRRDARGEERPPGVTVERLSIPGALWIGAFQAVAILPGVSRSGSTITAGLLYGLDADAAARFSFLLSIPAILGALVLDLGNVIEQLSAGDALGAGPLLVGFLAAACSGYLAIAFLLRMLVRGRLLGFALYCFLLAALVLVGA